MGNGQTSVVNDSAKEPHTASTSPQRNEGCSRKHMPAGRGPCGVGCVDLMTDKSSHDIFMRLYYPTAKANIERRTLLPHWLPSEQYAKGYANFMGKKHYGTLLNWLGGDVYIPATWLAPILKDSGKFPLVVFSHGLGGNRTTYSTICCDVASHGFIVASLEHRDGSASMTFSVPKAETDAAPTQLPNYLALNRQYGIMAEWMPYERPNAGPEFDFRNPQLHQRGADCIRCLDLMQALNNGSNVSNILPVNCDLLQYKDSIDMEKAAVMGHSFGGGTAVCALAMDKRFRVGVCLDGWMMPLEKELYGKISQPVLFVNTETFQWPENVNDMLRLDPVTVERPMITIMGSCHQSMSDFQFLVNSMVGKLLRLRHTLSPQVCMDIMNDASVSFLHKHLGIPGKQTVDEVWTGKRPHVIIGTNIDLLASTVNGPKTPES